MKNNVKISLIGGNLKNELEFDIYCNDTYVGQTGEFLGDSEELAKIDALAEEMAFQREIRIKFYAINDFELSQENIAKHNLNIDTIAEEMFLLGVPIDAFKKNYTHLFQ